MTIIASSNTENTVFVVSFHLHWRRAKRRPMHELIIMQIIIVMIITRHNKLSWNEITSSRGGKGTLALLHCQKEKEDIIWKMTTTRALKHYKTWMSLRERGEMLWNGCDTAISVKALLVGTLNGNSTASRNV